jgi:hypothetical protein
MSLINDPKKLKFVPPLCMYTGVVAESTNDIVFTTLWRQFMRVGDF